MFNRRDETRKLIWLLFLELTTDGGLKFIKGGLAHHIRLPKKELSRFCRVSIKSAYGMKLMVWKTLSAVEKNVICMEKLHNVSYVSHMVMC